MQVGTNPNTTWQMEALTALFEPTARSGAFTETYSTLVQMARERRLTLEKVEIPVDINLYDHNKQFTFDVLSLFARHHHRQLDDGVSFVVGTVSLVWSASIDSTALYDAGVATVQHHILLKHGLSSYYPSASAERKAMWRWMATATGLRGIGSVLLDSEDSGSDDQMLSPSHRVRCQKLPKEVFATLCASVMFSTRVQELGLHLTFSRESPLSCGLKWCWLIYALFNEASCHSVTTLNIDDAEFRMRDLVKVMMMKAQRPLEMLLDPEFDEAMEDSTPSRMVDSPTTRPARVVLRDGAPIYLDILRSESEPLVISSESRTYDVMGNLNDAYDILVPGYGQCWAKNEDVAHEVADTSSTRWRLKTHSITKLSIRADSRRQKSEDGGLGLLLVLIGTPITHLCLDFSSSDQLDHSQPELIWTYCPNLVFLTISNVVVDSFHSIADAYSSGRCQVSELSLNRCTVRDPASIIAFAETLADPNTRMSKTLRQLRLGLRDGNASLLEGETLEAFFAMLETNERLWHLLVQVDEDDLHWSNRRFAPFRGKTIRSPLPWPSKCAFMSVAKHIRQLEGDRNPLTRSITRLDSLALARIFDFAGEIHTRSVSIRLLN